MKERECNDKAFGVMHYKHGWVKSQLVSLFGKDWNIRISVRAYSEKPINELQQKQYSEYSNNEEKYKETISSELVKYINNNLPELAINWKEAKKIDSTNELAKIVTPRTLFFNQEGDVVLLLDCVWDQENGIGIQIIPKTAIGPQNTFL
ncbi:DUF6985 domain-containing protein [Succinivibrio dextrinosolvens]|uniref:DUF6985 domain-containing protein n=1 Tax=Succinivibrio dextrinosolvens TaxID=83771 RepID=UPI00241D81E0|nr:hypothetical protein [Succinivibrio dextrinosolvens]MBE6424211.1 hypothetical protein [Succinivibrio dextrinosolvens]